MLSCGKTPHPARVGNATAAWGKQQARIVQTTNSLPKHHTGRNIIFLRFLLLEIMHLHPVHLFRLPGDMPLMGKEDQLVLPSQSG